MTPVALSVVLEWLSKSGLVEDGSLECGGVENCNLECRDLVCRENFLLTGFASLDKANESDVTFWLADTCKSETNANGFSAEALHSVKAGLLFVPKECAASTSAASSAFATSAAPGVKCVVPVKNPYHAMVEFLKEFGENTSGLVSGCAASAEVHPSAVIEGFVGENTFVGPNCVVMRGARIGANCRLEANVTIYPNVEVGEGCIFQAGAVIGSRGFGFYEYEGRRLMVPHVAGVRIGCRSSFGANMVVAAGFVSPTTIGNDCHFDSFVQIAHNCVLGNNIFMASQSGIAGTVTVEDDVEFAGGAQSAGHLTIGKGARIAAKAGVTKNVPAGRTVAGFPAVEIDQWRRSVVNLRLMGKK